MNTAIALPVDAPAVVPSAGATRVPAAQTTGQGFGQCLAVALSPLLGMPDGQAPAMPARLGTTDPASPQVAEGPIDPLPVNGTLIAVPDVTQAPASATPAAPTVATPTDDAGTPPTPVALAPLVIPEPDATPKPAGPGKPNAAPAPRNGKPAKDDKATAPPAAAASLPLLVVVTVAPPPPAEAVATPAGRVAPPNLTAIDTAGAKPHTRAPDDDNAPEIASPSPTPPPLTHTAVTTDPEPAGATPQPHLPALMPLDTSVQPPPSPLPSSPARDVAALDPSAASLTRSSPADQVGPAVVSLTQLSGGAHHVTVQLQPSELGHVQIRIVQLVDAAPRIEISAERPQTLALLQRDEAQLHRALDQAGVMPDGRALSFHLSPADTQNGPPSSRSGDATFDMAGQRQGGSSQSQSQGSQAGSRDDPNSEPQPLASVTRWFRAGIDITA